MIYQPSSPRGQGYDIQPSTPRGQGYDIPALLSQRPGLLGYDISALPRVITLVRLSNWWWVQEYRLPATASTRPDTNMFLVSVLCTWHVWLINSSGLHIIFKSAFQKLKFTNLQPLLYWIVIQLKQCYFYVNLSFYSLNQPAPFLPWFVWQVSVTFILGWCIEFSVCLWCCKMIPSQC